MSATPTACPAHSTSSAISASFARCHRRQHRRASLGAQRRFASTTAWTAPHIVVSSDSQRQRRSLQQSLRPLVVLVSRPSDTAALTRRFSPYSESLVMRDCVMHLLDVWPNHALQRTRPSRSGCHPRLPWAGSLTVGRCAVVRSDSLSSIRNGGEGRGEEALLALISLKRFPLSPALSPLLRRK